MHLLFHGLAGGGVKAAASGHVQGLRARTVDFVDVVDESDFVFFRGFKDHGSRPVAENHTCGSIGVIDDR